jgi:large repetitive protein
MGLSWISGRGTATRRKGKEAPGRARGRTKWGIVEALEGRCLLAVTSTTPVPINVIEGSVFNGDVMDFTANDAGPFTATIVWGDLTTTAGVVTPVAGGFAVSGTHTYAEDGSYTATVTIVDTADATTVANTTTATVGEGVLTSTATPFTQPEGPGAPTVTTGTFTDPGSPDPASSYTASIDWGDGTTTPGTVVLTGPGAYGVTGSHVYSDEGSFTAVTTFFENSDPGFTITTSSTATVTEADAFTAGLIVIPPAVAIEGSAYSGPVATFTDSGFPTNTAADLTATINWGDGTTTAGTLVADGTGGFTVNGTHTFAEEGTNPITVLVADDAPGTATLSISGPISIADAPLTASPVAVNGTEGAPLTNVDVATFTDADPLGTVTDFLATVNWGDGTPVTAGTIVQDAAGTFHVQGSHTYTDPSAPTYAIAVNIIDNGNGRTVTDPSDSTATAASTATIVQSPLLPVSNAVVGTEGTAIPAGTTLASFTDTGGAGPVADYTATVDWGDGSGAHPAVVVASPAGGGTFLVQSGGAFTYPEEGIFAVKISITDTDAASPGALPSTALTTNTATIADAALTASATQPTVPAQTEGAAFSGPVASFTDANATAPLSDFVATIDWGDGSPTSLGSLTQPGGVGTAFLVSGNHTYTENGVFTMTVVTTDNAGSTVTTTTPVVVGDPALTGATAVPVQAVEGASTGQITVATFIDPDPFSTAHDWNATIDWGDGSPISTATLILAGGDPVSGGNIFKVVGTHIFAVAGPPSGTPAVTITDVDDATSTPTVVPITVTVVGAALTSQGAPVQAVEGIPFTGQLVATVTDANPAATTADFTTPPGSITVDWGDGTTSTLTSTPPVTITASGSPNGVVFSIFGSHTYAEEGSYKVTVTATEAGGGTTIAHSQATVTDALLTAPAVQTAISTTEATTFSVPVFGAPVFTGSVGTFSDANPAGAIDDFRATIDWGDGTAQSAGTVTQPGGAGTAFIVSGSHTYADSGVNGGTGTFAVTVYVNDDGGSVATIHNTANVADNPIALSGKLDSASDTGLSNADSITSINQPTFTGSSEPFSHVFLYASVLNADGTVTTNPIAMTQAGSDGSWSVKSFVALTDGTYTITATALDQFSKTTVTTGAAPIVITMVLQIDTVGPKVADVFFDRLNGQVDVAFTDNLSGMNDASIGDASNYSFAKVRAARQGAFLYKVNVIGISPNTNATTETVTLTINGGQPIRGGHYLFTIHSKSSALSSGVQDLAGNALDGEFFGFFPSGNNVPGGDFVARIYAVHNRILPPMSVIGNGSPVVPPGTPALGGTATGGPTAFSVHDLALNTVVVPKKSHRR